MPPHASAPGAGVSGRSGGRVLKAETGAQAPRFPPQKIIMMDKGRDTDQARYFNWMDPTIFSNAGKKSSFIFW